jgi:hypothetical protein
MPSSSSPSASSNATGPHAANDSGPASPSELIAATVVNRAGHSW